MTAIEMVTAATLIGLAQLWLGTDGRAGWAVPNRPYVLHNPGHLLAQGTKVLH